MMLELLQLDMLTGISDYFTAHGAIIAVILSLVGIAVGLNAERQARASASYTDIDTILKDVLSGAMDNPEFRDQKKIEVYWIEKEKKEFDYAKYDIYAEMCMNMVETIYDSALDNDKNRVTYAPTTVWEIILHGKWFVDDSNKSKFKEKFRKFVKRIHDELGDKPNNDEIERITKDIAKFGTEVYTDDSKKIQK
jgi:hypothetical protein